MTIIRTTFERIYRAKKDTRIRERMLLVLNVSYYDKVATHVAREIHRSKGLSSQWLKRYREEGMEGLKDRPKSERHPKISRQTEYRIKTILKESNNNSKVGQQRSRLKR